MTPEQIIDRAVDLLTSHYVLRDRVAAMCDMLQEKLSSGVYEGIDGKSLCQAITRDIRSAHNDPHLRLVWHDEKRQTLSPHDLLRMRREWDEKVRLSGGGIGSVTVLPGNVGLLDLDAVGSPDVIGTAVAAAFEIVANTFALILDLRSNGGGSPHGAALVCSYFFDKEPVHLNNIHQAWPEQVMQMWTYPDLRGPRYLDRPVYILTSTGTFSGAEDIAYTLQAFGRATIVGEASRGGAHPAEMFRISPHIDIRIPNARTVSTITKSNWEGTGVKPDIAVDRDQALTTASVQAWKYVSGLPDQQSRAFAQVRQAARHALADTT